MNRRSIEYPGFSNRDILDNVVFGTEFENFGHNYSDDPRTPFTPDPTTTDNLKDIRKELKNLRVLGQNLGSAHIKNHEYTKLKLMELQDLMKDKNSLHMLAYQNYNKIDPNFERYMKLSRLAGESELSALYKYSNASMKKSMNEYNTSF